MSIGAPNILSEKKPALGGLCVAVDVGLFIDLARSALCSIFHLCIFYRLPLHVAWLVDAASTERNDVVNDIALAG